MRRLVVIGLLVGLLGASAALAGTTGVVFKSAKVTARAGGGAINVQVTVACTGAKHFSAHVWLAYADSQNKTFFDKTLTGAVAGNKGQAATTYRGVIPAAGFVVAGSNTFCWANDKSAGVGYRSLYYATCAPSGTCTATASPGKR